MKIPTFAIVSIWLVSLLMACMCSYFVTVETRPEPPACPDCVCQKPFVEIDAEIVDEMGRRRGYLYGEDCKFFVQFPAEYGPNLDYEAEY